MKSIIYNLEDLDKIVDEIISNWQHKIILFDAPMGAGKTTLIKRLVTKMGVQDATSSPTFSIVNEYFSQEFGEIFHFDCYRLKNMYEALDMGIEDYLYNDKFCFIEWPDKIEGILPENHHSIKIEILEDGKRQLFFQ